MCISIKLVIGDKVEKVVVFVLEEFRVGRGEMIFLIVVVGCVNGCDVGIYGEVSSL